MFDLHCHALPGLDDGARTWSEALAIASELAAHGVRVMALTPHFHPETWPADRPTIQARTEELRARLEEAAVPLRVVPGAEVVLDAALPQWLREGRVPLLGPAGRHVLLTLPEAGVPLWTQQVLFELQLHGIMPIIAHPERNAAVAADLSAAQALIQQGALLQLDAGSLLGRYGPTVRRTAEALVRRGLIHCLGSDAHRPGRAGPDWTAGVLRLRRLAGAEGALRTTHRIPALVVAGVRVTPEAADPRRGFNWFRRPMPSA